jgi:hypothetical protein
MSEEITNTEAVEEEMLINIGKSNEEVQEEAPIPLHDKPEGDLNEDGEIENKQKANERPDYYPEKFWTETGPDVEKLAKSYNELEKQFRSGKNKAPTDKYDVKALVESGLDPEDPSLNILSKWAKDNGISQKSFDDLANQVFAVNKDIIEQQERSYANEIAKLGEKAKEKIAMAERLLTKSPLTTNEKNVLANTLNNADAINAFLKYHRSITNESIPVKTAVNSSEISRLDLESAIADPRWKSDAAWRQKIEQQWFKTSN